MEDHTQPYVTLLSFHLNAVRNCTKGIKSKLWLGPWIVKILGYKGSVWFVDRMKFPRKCYTMHRADRRVQNCIISEAWRKSMSHFGPNMNILGTSLLFSYHSPDSKGGAWLSNWQQEGPLGPGFPHWEDLQHDEIKTKTFKQHFTPSFSAQTFVVESTITCGSCSPKRWMGLGY